MKVLLVVTGFIETGAALALLIAPSVTVELLLGSSVDLPSVATIGRTCRASPRSWPCGWGPAMTMWNNAEHR
jgi:hypothetical protein